MAERGFYAKELNVGWKEWTANRHPTHASKVDGPHCTCSQLAPRHDVKAIADLANSGQLAPADRLKLLTGLGELLLARGKGDEGVSLLKTAGREHPFDLGSRLVLFEWAVATDDAKLRDEVIAEIRRRIETTRKT